MKTAFLVLALVGCVGNDDPSPDATTPVEPCDRAAESCRAARDIARSVCQRNERCNANGADVDACVIDVITEICATSDCSSAYTDRDRLDACIRDYEAAPCVVVEPLLTCTL